MNSRVSLVSSLICVALLAGCSSDSSSPSGGNGPLPDFDRKLKKLNSDEAFVEALRVGLIAQRSSNYYGVVAETGATDTDTSAPGSTDGGLTDSSGANSSTESGNEVTSTNVQEQGVDEQDWVKLSSDGNWLYVLDRGYTGFNGGAVPLTDEAGTSMPVPQPVKTTLRILQLDADAPDASAANDLDIELEGRTAEGFYLYENGSARQAVLTSTGSNYWAYWSEPMAFSGQNSLITRVDISDSANAAVNGSLHLDGQLVSSRRIGNYLFFASRFSPNVSIPGVEDYEMTLEQWQNAVNNASDDELLPHYSVGDSGEQTLMVDPGDCFVSDAASNADYYSPDIITLGVVDLDTLQLSDSACYLGASETLYASPEAVFLATTQYDYSVGPVNEQGIVVDTDDVSTTSTLDIFWSDPRVDTDIHQFDIDAGKLVYAGTGTVQGHLGWNPLRKPFRMSEKDGYLRVATINDLQGPDASPILLTVLQADGQGELVTVSSLPSASHPAFIGKPGEQLYASRFLGDRAYLVTFRQTDPLYVVDLADPSNPELAGELEIEGYSDYLHPIDENYLLGLGKDAVAAPNGLGDGRGALVQGVKLSLFDVSNPASPGEVQSVLIGQRGTESRALNDHRGITVQAATDEHPTRVSFGIDVSGQTFPSSSPSGNAAETYYPWSHSGLFGFDINTGTDAGIVSRGAMLVETNPNNTGNEFYYSPYVDDRSVMVNDSLFYIRGSKVYAAPWADLANPTPAR